MKAAGDNWRDALSRFLSEMKAIYGSRLDCVVLYGSRARGDAEAMSDVDTLIVLDVLGDFWAEFNRISPIASRLSLEHDVVISALPVDKRAFAERSTPLFMNARREGTRVA